MICTSPEKYSKEIVSILTYLYRERVRGLMQARDLPSTFLVAVGPSVKYLCCRCTFCQLFAQLQDLLSTSVTFPRITFCQLSAQLQALLSTFPAAVGPFVNFCHLFVRPEHPPLPGCRIFPQLPSTFRAATGPSTNFLCCHRTFRRLVSTFCAAAGSSINFTSGRGTFLQLL